MGVFLEKRHLQTHFPRFTRLVDMRNRTISDGKHILAAGEIGAYTVCPESWRLRMVARVKGESTSTAKEGHRLHAQWAKNYDDSVFLIKLIRTFVLLFVLAALIYWWL